MPNLNVTTTQTTEVELAPILKRRLQNAIKGYTELKAQRDMIDAAMKGHRDSIEDVLNEVGESTLKVDGYTTTLVAPLRKKFDPKKFVALGGDLAVYHAAEIEVPQKAYVRVSIPGAKEESHD